MQERASKVLGKALGCVTGLIVCGAQWGDEGKGKITDLLAFFYDIVGRFGGGANAGHTTMENAVKVVSHQIPSGLLRGKPCILGRGVLIDIERLVKEIADAKIALDKLGKPMPIIRIDRGSPLWTPWHPLLENYLEIKKGDNKVGTTGRAIGPLEGLYKLRISLVVSDLFGDKVKLLQKLRELYATLEPLFREMKLEGKITSRDIQGPDAIAEYLLRLASQVEDYVADTRRLLNPAGTGTGISKRLLIEAAQAIGLDPYWGTYPFVTSGTAIAAGAPAGLGLPMKFFQACIMVLKAFPTRVGKGPFPSEIWDRDLAEIFSKNNTLFTDETLRQQFLSKMLRKINNGIATDAEIAQYIQVLGMEMGASTGRGRSVGWLDLFWLAYAIAVNGPKWLALTRFDMLSGLKSVKVATGYKLGGKELDPGEMPTTDDLYRVEPIYEEWSCWDEDITGCTSFEDLPRKAKIFLTQIENRLGVPILLVGTGPEREDIIVIPPMVEFGRKSFSKLLTNWVLRRAT